MIKMDYSKEAYNIYKNRRGVDMNKVQQKKWISVLGMGVFILTMLSICILHSDEEIAHLQESIQILTHMQRTISPKERYRYVNLKVSLRIFSGWISIIIQCL